MVNEAREAQRQEKPWWSGDTDVKIVRETWRKKAKDKPNHLTVGSLQRFPQENWSLTASSGKANDQRNRERVVLDLFSNFEEVDPAHSHHAPEWKVAVEVISTTDEGRPGEHLHAALPVRRERLPGPGSPSFSGWIPSSSRRGRCYSSPVTVVKTRHTKPPSQDRHEGRQERCVPTNHRRPDFACIVLLHGVSRCCVPFLSHALSQVHRRSDDDGSRKRGVPCGRLTLNLPDGEASFRSLDDNGDGADCVISFGETVQMLSHAGVDGALERCCGFLFLLQWRRVFFSCWRQHGWTCPQPHENR